MLVENKEQAKEFLDSEFEVKLPQNSFEGKLITEDGYYYILQDQTDGARPKSFQNWDYKYGYEVWLPFEIVLTTTLAKKTYVVPSSYKDKNGTIYTEKTIDGVPIMTLREDLETLKNKLAIYDTIDWTQTHFKE